MDDSLEVPDLLGVGQLGGHVFSSVSLPGNIVHFETFEIVNVSLRDMIVLEQHCFLGLVYVGNMSLDKLKVCVASQLLRVILLEPSRMIPALLPFTLDEAST